MHLVDWLIVALFFCGLAGVAATTKRYMRGVADFLAANRCAGRYLLTMADGMAGLGAIGIIGAFQQNYQAGLGASWWGGIMAPLMLLLPLTGFIIYRFRETRVMTIAQFYELRYSRRFRIFAGILAWVSGVINYGIFPSVTARFFIHFCGLPRWFLNLGPLHIDLTFALVMALLLATALSITFRGGQIAIMVTDFLQAQYVNIIFLVVLAALLARIGLGDLIDTLKRAPAGQSMLNPFQQGEIPDFNVFYFVIMAFNAIYTYMAWQGNQGFNCSARTPHDAKMARILSAWRYGATWTVITLIPLFAYALLHGTHHLAQADAARSLIDSLGSEGLRRQLTVPLALRQILPLGVFGLFVAAMLAAAVSNDNAYLHSWGSIFIQDVVMPFRQRPLAPEEHLKWLKRSILGVAVFAWFFGLIFPLQEYIFMYWAITGAIYVGGAGSVIIGGFYWKRGTTAGAWAGMITGSLLAFSGIAINNIFWPYVLPGLKAAHPELAWLQALPKDFWLNGMQISFAASLSAVAAYVTGSLLSRPNPGFEMDRLLHRGRYAVAGEHTAAGEEPQGLFWRMLGVTREYSRGDKLIAISVLAWTALWFTVFIAGTLLGLKGGTTDAGWARFWVVQMAIYLVVGLVTVIWFVWCGFRDLGEMFRTLRTMQRDQSDDGIVRQGERAQSEPEPARAGQE